MPFHFPPGPSPADEDPAPVVQQDFIGVRGNCGKIHSYKEWIQCRACDSPEPLEPWWRWLSDIP